MPDGFDFDQFPRDELDPADPAAGDAQYAAGERALAVLHARARAGHYAQVIQGYEHYKHAGLIDALSIRQRCRLLFLVARAHAHLGHWHAAVEVLIACKTHLANGSDPEKTDPVAWLHVHLLLGEAADRTHQYHRSGTAYQLVLMSIARLESRHQTPAFRCGNLALVRCRALIGLAHVHCREQSIAKAQQMLQDAIAILLPWLDQRFQTQTSHPRSALERQIPPNLLPLAPGDDALQGRLLLHLHATKAFIELWQMRIIGHEDDNPLNWAYTSGRDTAQLYARLPEAEHAADLYLLLAEYALESARRKHTRKHYDWLAEVHGMIEAANSIRTQLQADGFPTYVLSETTKVIEFENRLLRLRADPQDPALQMTMQEVERFCTSHRRDDYPHAYLRGRGYAVLSRFAYLNSPPQVVDRHLKLAQAAFDLSGDTLWHSYIGRRSYLHE
jgi:hypothetical protein